MPTELCGIEDWIWFYYEKGFSIFPIKQTDPPSFDNKKPAVSSWKEYMNRRATKEEIEKWIQDGLFGNIAIVCGAVSGNLVILDLDDKDIVPDLELDLDKMMEERGLWVQCTGKEGRYHIFCKNKEDPGGIVKDNLVHLEYRANGGYCVVTPSVHPNGNIYHFLNFEKPKDLPELKEWKAKDIFTDMIQRLYKKRELKPPKEFENKTKTGEAPCIKKLLEGGLNEGSRNDSAFCLALWYRDIKKMSPTEIRSLVSNWNNRNKPPLPSSELSSVVTSALKAQKSTGCKRIGELGFCTVDDKKDCPFFARPKGKKDKEKEQIEEVPCYKKDSILYEQVYNRETFETKFVYIDEGEIKYTDEVEHNGIKFIPINDREAIDVGAVYFPVAPMEYGTITDLVGEVRTFIHKYMDVSPLFELFSSWYVVFSWVTDNIRTVPYLMVRADFATGKSRFLHTVGRLCYRAYTIAGSTTPASVFRSIQRWKGTLLLEEFTLKESGEEQDIIKVLNCGYERGNPVIRCDSELNKMFYFDTFGPKIISSRKSFKDEALNSRCLSEVLTETCREDIPVLLPEEFFVEQDILRNKLLMFRLNHWNDIEPSAIQTIKFPKGISKRLRQGFSSFAVLFCHDKEALDYFMGYVEEYNKELIEERAQSFDGMIVNSVCNMKNNGYAFITAKLISDDLAERGITGKNGGNISASIIGRHLKTLGLPTKAKKIDGKTQKVVSDNPKILKLLKEKYVVDEEEEITTQEMLFDNN